MSDHNLPQPAIGLVGTGVIARFHLAAMRRTGANLVAIGDQDPAAGRAFAAEAGTEFVGGYPELVADPRVTAVLVATPNHTHHVIARAALEAGKDLFCEKPLTTNPEQSADLVRLARERPRQVVEVGYMKRYNAGFRLVRDLLPRLGDLASVHIRILVETRPSTATTWYRNAAKAGGGVLAHSGSHLLDVTRWLFGDPVRVDSRVRFVPDRPGSDWATVALIDLADGPPVYFSTLAVPIANLGHSQQGWEETIEVIGTAGRLLLSSPNWQGTLPPVVTLQLDEEGGQRRTIYPEPTNQWETQMAAFSERLRDRRPGEPGVVDGYKVDEIIAAIYASGERRAPVDVRWRV